MTQKTYRRLPVEEMRRRRWKVVHELRVQQGYTSLVLKEGELVRVIEKNRGTLTIEGIPCMCCGVAIYMEKVPFGAVEEDA